VKNIFVFFIALSLVLLSTSRCARKGSPDGGPKDSLSPVMVTAYPPYKATNFKETRIKLQFDEYVKFKDMNKQLIISPPLKQMPVIKPQGTASKNITIEILDTLKENTTYSINFGNSIIDNNEGNKLGSFKYVFSTGSYVDSLEIFGDIIDAFDRETEDNIAVLLYEVDENYTDSIIYKEKPTYVTNTLDTTNFNITNIKAGKYQLLALKDFNNNFIYNPKQDKIAFLSEPISIPTDSVALPLNIFKEVLDFRLLRPLENKKGKIVFGFEGHKQDINIELLTKKTDSFREQISLERDLDTINYWYTAFESDSIQFKVTGKNLDTIFTVKTRTSKIDTLELTEPVKNILHPKDTFHLLANIPLDSLDLSKINIVDKDTLPINFNAFFDKEKTKMNIHFKRKRNEIYQIDILPNAFVDFFGSTNDTLQYTLKTVDIEDYGIIELKLKKTNNEALIVDLVNKKGDLIERQFIGDKKDVTFNDIKPETYFVRIITDSNKNRKWDSGNFLKKIQPEKVQYFSKELKLRANWTINEDITLE
jgi:uncharacterized protein (DUF2141 family)